MKPRLAQALTAVAIAAVGYIAFARLPLEGDLYHPDEGVWTAVSKYYFQKAFIELDWSKESWKVDFGHFGRYNPNVGRYIIGASLFAHGVVDRDTAFPGYEPGFRWEDVEHRRPPPEILAAARAPMRHLMVGCALLLFLLVQQLFGSSLVAASAALLFLTKPLVLTSGHRAMMEMPAQLFSLAALYLAARFLALDERVRATRGRAYALLIGVSCGLGAATKLNTLLAPLTILIWSLHDLVQRRGLRPGAPGSRSAGLAGWNVVSRLRRLARGERLGQRVLIASGALAFVFLATNPLLFHDPVRGTAKILQLGRLISRYEIPAQVRLDSPAARLEASLEIGLGSSGPADHWLGLGWLDEALAIAGLAFCIRGLMRRGRDERRSLPAGSAPFLIWGAVTLGGVLLWTPFRWDRWFVPLEAWWASAEALGIAAVSTGAWRLARWWAAQPRRSLA